MDKIEGLRSIFRGDIDKSSTAHIPERYDEARQNIARSIRAFSIRGETEGVLYLGPKRLGIKPNGVYFYDVIDPNYHHIRVGLYIDGPTAKFYSTNLEDDPEHYNYSEEINEDDAQAFLIDIPQGPENPRFRVENPDLVDAAYARIVEDNL